MAKKFYKNIWEEKGNKNLRITKEKYGIPRQLKNKYFREDFSSTRPSVIMKFKNWKKK